MTPPLTLRAPALPALPLDVAPEVAGALAAGRPVVALESTIITHGMPWPQNLETAQRVEAAVREAGAVPATVAVRGLEIDLGFGYGGSGATWLFDRAALVAAGATIADVTSVVSSAPAAHTLTWQDLGVDLV